MKAPTSIKKLTTEATKHGKVKSLKTFHNYKKYTLLSDFHRKFYISPFFFTWKVLKQGQISIIGTVQRDNKKLFAILRKQFASWS